VNYDELRQYFRGTTVSWMEMLVFIQKLLIIRMRASGLLQLKDVTVDGLFESFMEFSCGVPRRLSGSKVSDATAHLSQRGECVSDAGMGRLQALGHDATFEQYVDATSGGVIASKGMNNMVEAYASFPRSKEGISTALVCYYLDYLLKHGKLSSAEWSAAMKLLGEGRAYVSFELFVEMWRLLVKSCSSLRYECLDIGALTPDTAANMFEQQFRLIDYRCTDRIDAVHVVKILRYFGITLTHEERVQYLGTSTTLTWLQYVTLIMNVVVPRLKTKVPKEAAEVKVVDVTVHGSDMQMRLGCSDSEAVVKRYVVKAGGTTTEIAADGSNPVTCVSVPLPSVSQQTPVEVYAEVGDDASGKVVHTKTHSFTVYPPTCHSLELLVEGVAKADVPNEPMTTVVEAVSAAIGDAANGIDVVCTTTQGPNSTVFDLEVVANPLMPPAEVEAAIKAIHSKTASITSEIKKRSEFQNVSRTSFVRSRAVDYKRQGNLVVNVRKIRGFPDGTSRTRVAVTGGSKRWESKKEQASRANPGTIAFSGSSTFELPERENELQIEVVTDSGTKAVGVLNLLHDMEPGHNDIEVDTGKGIVEMSCTWVPRPRHAELAAPSSPRTVTPVEEVKTRELIREKSLEKRPAEKMRLGIYIEPGMYTIEGKKCLVRIVGTQILVRTGGGWVEMRQWLISTFGAESEIDLSEYFSVPQKAGMPKQKLFVRDIEAATAIYALEKKKKGPAKRR